MANSGNMAYQIGLLKIWILLDSEGGGVHDPNRSFHDPFRAFHDPNRSFHGLSMVCPRSVWISVFFQKKSMTPVFFFKGSRNS